MISIFFDQFNDYQTLETTVINSISTLVHHGIIFVPLGYSTVFGQLANLTEVHGGKHLTPDLSSPCIVSLQL